MTARTATAALLTLLLAVGVGLLARGPAPAPAAREPPEAGSPSNGHTDVAPLGQALGHWLRRGVDRLERLRQRVPRAYVDLVRETYVANGWQRFDGVIPEDICYRDYDYMHRVGAAWRKRWFSPMEGAAFEAAQEALAETHRHRERLVRDPLFRAADAQRARIAMDPRLGPYVRAMRWVPPHLICYTSGRRIENQETLFLSDRPEVAAQRAELLAERKRLAGSLDDAAATLQQLYAEFFRRYGARLRLRDLSDPYGGRADLTPGTRSFHDGVALVVWIFEDEASYRRHHTNVMKEWIRPDTHGYFSARDGAVWVHDGGTKPAERAERVPTALLCATHQLVYWFSRQRLRWAKPYPSRRAFGQGFSRWMSGVRVAEGGALEFTGWNRHQLVRLQATPRLLSRRGGQYGLFPLQKLVSITSYGEAQAFGTTAWGADPDLVLSMFVQQSYALVLFLHTHAGGRYREGFLRWFDLVLHGEGRDGGGKAFAEAFRLQDEDDWLALETPFHAFIRDDLMKRDLDAPKWWASPARKR